MNHFSVRTSAIAASLLLAVTALGACGGGDSDAERTRNAPITGTCAEGGECVVGDIGPGGGTVFYDAGKDEEWGRYMEVMSPGWAGVNDWPIDPKARLCADAESCPEFTQKNRTIGFGKSTWAEVSERECTSCAQTFLKRLNEGEVKDWFLPNIRELRALLQSGINRTFDTDAYTSISSSRELLSDYLIWRIDWTLKGAVRATGTKVRRIVPIRQFSAKQIVETEVEQSTVLETVTNLRVKFEAGKMIFDFDRATKGLSPEGHFVLMYWEVLSGSNGIMISGDSTSASTDIYPFMRGTKLTAYVRSYTNATQPSSTVDTEKIEITIPMTDDTPVSTPAVVPPTDVSVGNEIGNVNKPILNVPVGGTEGEINPDSLIDNLATEVPEAEVEKIEILVRTPESGPEEDWKPVSTETPTPYSIPGDATSVTLRITTTDGNVIEQEKQVVHVAASGEASLPEVAPVVSATTTTVATSESTTTVATSGPTTTVATSGTTVKKPAVSKPTTPSSIATEDTVTDSTVAVEEESVGTTLPEAITETTQVVTSAPSDGSSGPSPILWLIIAIIAILATVFGVKKMRDQQKD